LVFTLALLLPVAVVAIVVDIIKPPQSAPVRLAPLFPDPNINGPPAEAHVAAPVQHRRRNAQDDAAAAPAAAGSDNANPAANGPAQLSEAGGKANKSGEEKKKKQKGKPYDAERKAWLARVRDSNGEAKAVIQLNNARKSTKFQAKFDNFVDRKREFEPSLSSAYCSTDIKSNHDLYPHCEAITEFHLRCVAYKDPQKLTGLCGEIVKLRQQYKVVNEWQGSCLTGR
jgi:hypothetical protein